MQAVDKIYKILIIEDEADIRQVLCFFLRHSGFDVLDVASGEDAMNIIPEYQPDLLVLDIMMPGKSGWEVLHWLHEVYHQPMLPVVLLTALVQFSDQIRGFEEGAVEYITKPMQPMKVVERVRLLLSLTAEQRLLRQRKRIDDQKKMLARLSAAKEDDFNY